MLFNLFTRNGTQLLPRRVALIDNVLYELSEAPEGSQECHILSKTCEHLRELRGEPVYTRSIERLLFQCLQSNDDDAWAALWADFQCKLVGDDLLKTYFEERPDDAACFVWRFEGSRSIVQSAHILKVFEACAQHFSLGAKNSFSGSLRYGHGRAFVSAYASHAKVLPSKERQVALETLGRALVVEDAYKALVTDVFGSLESKNGLTEDILAILVASPCASMMKQCVIDHMYTVATLVKMAEKTPVPRRGPLLQTLALLCGEEDAGNLRPLIVHTCSCASEGSTSVVFAALNLVAVIESPCDVSGSLARALVMGGASEVIW